MAYSQWGTRKALGRRYGVDPALLMESERLQQEYNLAPGREARGMQASQFQQNLALQEERDKQAGKAGMVGTVANLGTNAAMLRALTMEKGQPFFGNWGGTAAPAGGGATQSFQAFTPAESAGLASQTAAGTTVNPAMVDTAAGMGSTQTSMTVGAGVPAEGGAVAAEGTGGATIGGAASVAGYITAAELAKQQWGGLDTSWDEKTTAQRFTSAPGREAALPGINLVEKFVGGNKAYEDSLFGKAGKEMARVEQQVMMPIDAILGIDNKGAGDRPWVLCSELVRQGKLAQSIVDDEWEYIREIITAEQYEGYRILVDPIVSLMQRSKMVTWIMAPCIRAFAYEMASRVNPAIKGNRFGKFILLIGLPLCSMVSVREVCHG